LAICQRKLIGWDLRRHPPYEHEIQQQHALTMMSVDQRGELLVTCSPAGEIETWDLTAPTEEFPLTRTRLGSWSLEATTNPLQLAVSRDGQWLAVTMDAPRREIRLYETQTGTLRGFVPMPPGSLGPLDFSPDSRQIATSVDADVLLLSIESLQIERYPIPEADQFSRITRLRAQALGMAYNPDGTMLATSGSDRRLRFWNPRDGSLLATHSGPLGAVHALTFTHEGGALLTAGDDGTIKIWNIAAQEELFDLHRDPYQHPSYLGISPNGRWLTCLRDKGHRLLLLDLGDPSQQRPLANTPHRASP
jgi:WD40 repeat protein